LGPRYGGAGPIEIKKVSSAIDMEPLSLLHTFDTFSGAFAGTVGPAA